MKDLIEATMTDCTMLDKTTVSDGLGSFTYQWVSGATFRASIVKETDGLTTIANKIAEKDSYVVIVQKGLNLVLNDVFKRNSDGATFRVTSSITDSEVPAMATKQIGKVTAERWDPV